MERKFLQGNWIDMRGQLTDWWDELTEDDLDLVDGDEDQLIRVLQDRYGYTEEMARVEIEKRMTHYDPEGREI